MGPLQRKLSKERAEYIRMRHAEGYGVRELARMMDVSPATVSRVVNRHVWIGSLRERLNAAERELAELKARVNQSAGGVW